jgi:hypothetical protein
MAEDQDSGVTISVILQTAPVPNPIESTEVPTSMGGIQSNPVKEITSISIAGPLNYPRMQTEEQPAIREYFEVPY